jgi:hypothetical protein
MTFDYYGIREGDVIVALPEGETRRPSVMNLWINMTRDQENVRELIRWMLDPTTSGEAARLRDLHMIKAEQRPRSFAKVCSTFQQANRQGSTIGQTTISSERPQFPSTDALPAVWSFDDDAPCWGEQ